MRSGVGSPGFSIAKRCQSPGVLAVTDPAAVSRGFASDYPTAARRNCRDLSSDATRGPASADQQNRDEWYAGYA